MTALVIALVVVIAMMLAFVLWYSLLVAGAVAVLHGERSDKP